MKNEKKYIIGLDVGTTSVGWAVVNQVNFEVMKKNKKALWGVSLFEEASTAENTRNFRSTRRRYDRRRKRIKLLQDEFREEINKVDPLFFTKLKESFYNEDDEVNKTIKLSNEEKELRKKHQQKYKTIYHLRKDLIDSTEKMDIRLVYLAIHHMIKYRGNFLYSSNFNITSINIPEKINQLLQSFNNLVDSAFINEFNNEDIDCKNITDIFNITYKQDRNNSLKEYFNNIFTKKVSGELTKALAGYKFNVYDLLCVDSDEKLSISLIGTDYEDNIDKLEQELGDKIETLSLIKDFYDMIFLKNLFKDEKEISISKLMVKRFDKHQEDLKYLKNLLNNSKENYNKIFRTKNKHTCIYDLYINNKLSYEEFTKEVIKYIDNDEYIINEIDNATFLPRITSVENGKFPFQLNKYELEKIIENQQKYYPFLNNKIDNKFKIVKLLEFRIPYYVGPLNDTTNVKNEKNKNAWLIKNSDEVITPYNFDKVINLDDTAKIFIERMLSNCSYLLKEKTMPANSLLYSHYKVLNELKQIKVNGSKLSTEFIKYTIDNLFKKVSGNISNKMFINFLRTSQEFAGIYDFEVTGYSDNMKFANDMQSYYDFFNEENGFLKDVSYLQKEKENCAETIINYITIFEDKDILEKKVREEFSELNEDVIKKIRNKNYKGWSRLSKKLLTERYYKDPSDNIYKSIIDLMYETQDNFMQILFKEDYGFQKFIQEENKTKNTNKLDYSVVSDLATSPSNKKGIYQTLKVINEIVDYMGYEPETIVLEMAKGNGIKKRTENRKNQLLKLYKDNKNSISDYNKLIGEMNGFEKINDNKLFLYFIQEGRSLYTNERIDINDLNSYEIDHIIPRTLIKDDSIDNLALVHRNENQIKKDSFVLPYEYRVSNINWWKSLKDKKLISSKKMYNLMRSEYSKEDIDGFINRQLVETRQITKHVSNIINSFYENTNVFYINANLSSNYRSKFNLTKFRDLNDYHHAHDAYLAAVLGEYKQHYFKKEIDISKISELNKLFIKNHDYKKIRYGYIINSLDDEIYFDDTTGEILEFNKKQDNNNFNNQKFNSTVKYNLYRNDILISKKTEIKTGEFYKQTIYSKNDPKSKNGIPIKDNLKCNLYGSYSSMNPSYMCLVQYNDNVKLVGIPILIDAKSKENKIHFIKEHLKLKDEDGLIILKDRIPFNTLINYDNQLCRITGYSNNSKSNELINAYQFKINKENTIKWEKTLLKVFKNINDEDYNKYNEDLSELFSYILEFIKSNHPIYINLISKLVNIDFKLLDENDKIKLVKELINMIKCNSVSADLAFLKSNFNNRVGRMNGKNINSGTLIFQSITGLREEKYKIEKQNI